MAQRFEDLIAWQKSRALTARVYQVTREGRFARDFGLANQIQRASVSVMANIAEGFERNRLTEFARYLEISRGSAAEVLSHLYVAKDVGHLDEENWQELFAQTREVARLLTALHRSVDAKIQASNTLREDEVTYDADGREGTGHWAPGTFE